MQTTTTWGVLTDDARQTISALAQLIETALAVDGAAWCAAIDDARTHRPIDRACDALAKLLGESPALWQEGLGYYPQRGARGLLNRAYERCRIETDDAPTFERDPSPGRPLPEALTPATLPIERIAAPEPTPTHFIWKDTPEPEPAPAPVPAPVHVAAPSDAPSDDDVPW